MLPALLRGSWIGRPRGRAAVASCGGGDHAPVEIRTWWTRADLVSGGDALVEIVAPPGTALQGLRVSLNGADVTGSFARGSDGRMVARVTGLADGQNVLRATTTDAPARLTVTNDATEALSSRGPPPVGGGFPSWGRT